MRHVLFFSAFLIFLLPAAVPAQTTFSGEALPRLSAVVAGVSKYKFSPEKNLDYAHRDAEQFARLLKCVQGVQVDTIITLLDEEATRGNLNRAFSFIRNSIADNAERGPDYIVFYFSGHGQLNDFNGENEGYFIMHDTDINSPEDFGYEHRTVVKQAQMWKKKCKVLIFSDACHSGRILGDEESESMPLLGELAQFSSDRTGRVFEIMSSGGGGKSYEEPALQHGLFTFYLIKGALGDADYNGDELISNMEIGNYVLEKVSHAEPDQKPVFMTNNHAFLRFSNCMDYSFDKLLASPGDARSVSREFRKVKTIDRPSSRFDSLLQAGMLCGDDKNSALGLLQRAKTVVSSSAYEDMRRSYVAAALEADLAIMHRYMNQDITPWTTKFRDMEQEVQIQKSLMDLLQPDDFLYRPTAARYYFFQAMSWYEYAKFADEPERRVRLEKAAGLIGQSLEYKPDSPVGRFLQSQILHALGRSDQTDRVAEVLKMAPRWRVPYLYALTDSALAGYVRLLEAQQAYNPITDAVVPVTDSLKRWSDAGRVTAEQISAAFARNPVFSEEVYLGRLAGGNTPAAELKQHREMAQKAFSYTMTTSPPVLPGTMPNKNGQAAGQVTPDRLPLFSGLGKLETDNAAVARVANQELGYARLVETDTVVSEATLARWAELDRYKGEEEEVGDAKKLPVPEDKSAGNGNIPASPPPPAVGESFTDPLVGKLIRVKGGTFTMGCTPEQGSDCESYEKPAHEVTLSDYYIGETEVTQAQWRAVMGNNPSGFKYCDECPVEDVSWNDVKDFISKLNSRSGGVRYRLPTEAEWEYAARGGGLSKGYKYAGSDDQKEVAWYDDNSGSKTHPVKGKKANELGIYDMSGNVYEWCSDWKDNYSSESQTSPTGPNTGDYRVHRGGGWFLSARGCRVSARHSFEPDYRVSFLGFRLASPAPR